MSLPESWRNAPGPEALFMVLWREASLWPSHRLTDCPTLAPEAQAELEGALVDARTATMAIEGLKVRLAALWDTIFAPDAAVRRTQQDALLLGAMMAIDEAFRRVHPRTPRLSAAALPVALPDWLFDAQEMRTLSGNYLEDGDLRLIARGPLGREARTVVDLNADGLTHHFLSLTAAPSTTTLDDNHPLTVACCVIGQGAARGVPPARPGREVVGFAPLAESDVELVYTERRDAAGQSFLDVTVSGGADLAARLGEAVAHLGALDLLVAPELTLDEAASARFAASLDPASAPRLSVAGSGPAGVADGAGRRFNTSSAYNAMGALLWSHDKVWPYGMGERQVETARLFDVEAGRLLMEDIRAGGKLTVADIDGFGRVLTLICQDFQIRPAVGDLVRTYQPDWVIVPVMDRGVALGRWMHDVAWQLSGLSPARFVVVSSLALADRSGAADYPGTPVALMVGPSAASRAERDIGGKDRAVALLSCTHLTPMCGKIGWNDRSSDWKQTTLGAI